MKQPGKCFRSLTSPSTALQMHFRRASNATPRTKRAPTKKTNENVCPAHMDIGQVALAATRHWILDTAYCTLPATGHSAGATVASECQDTLSSLLFSIRSLVWGCNRRSYGWLSVVFVIAKANEKLTVPRCFPFSAPLLHCRPLPGCGSSSASKEESFSFEIASLWIRMPYAVLHLLTRVAEPSLMRGQPSCPSDSMPAGRAAVA